MGRKDSLFMNSWENWTSTYKRMKLDSYLLPNTKVNDTWALDLSFRTENAKFLKVNIRKKLLDIGLDDGSLDMTPKTETITKAKPDKRESYAAKETSNGVKSQHPCLTITCLFHLPTDLLADVGPGPFSRETGGRTVRKTTWVEG